MCVPYPLLKQHCPHAHTYTYTLGHAFFKEHVPFLVTSAHDHEMNVHGLRDHDHGLHDHDLDHVLNVRALHDPQLLL